MPGDLIAQGFLCACELAGRTWNSSARAPIRSNRLLVSPFLPDKWDKFSLLVRQIMFPYGMNERIQSGN
jgi:hypothetical protein